MLKQTMIVASALLFDNSAIAHEGTGPNGGRLADKPKYHLELVVKADTVDVCGRLS